MEISAACLRGMLPRKSLEAGRKNCKSCEEDEAIEERKKELTSAYLISNVGGPEVIVRVN